MNNDFESATFARRRSDVSGTVRAAWDAVAVSLAALHRIQFAAPWKPGTMRPIA